RSARPSTREGTGCRLLRTSCHLPFGLVGDEPAEHLVRDGLFHPADGKTVDDLLEEALDQQPLRGGQREAPALEVVEALLVRWADRRAVAADHVVAEDLEVGHGVRLGALAEYEVAIGLEGARSEERRVGKECGC